MVPECHSLLAVVIVLVQTTLSVIVVGHEDA
jgi:hypothetical protein